MRKIFFFILIGLLAFSGSVVFAQSGDDVLTVYSGRNEELIGPLLEQFTADTGIQVQVLYGNTAAIANQIIEEGPNSPADVYIGQDAGALGVLEKAGLLAALPSDVTERIPTAFKSADDRWIGISGRARVLVYNPVLLEAQGLELPASILDLTDPAYSGLVGWAPANASTQANVTAMRILLGEEAAADWLEGMVANDAVSYGSSNTNLHQGVLSGEVVMGISNHYYLFRILEENPDAPLAHHFFPAGDSGSLINIAGAAVLATSDQQGLAQRLLLYMQGSAAQQYFADQTFEYPVIDGITVNDRLIPLEMIESPDIDLTGLDDLETTLNLIEDSGALDQ